MTQFQKGTGGREREEEGKRENTYVSSHRRLTTLFFPIDYSGNKFWRRNTKPSLSYFLYFVFYYFSHEVGLGLCADVEVCSP